MFSKLKLSWSKPTPKKAKKFVNFLLYCSGIWALIQPQFPNIPKEVEANIDKILLLSLALARFTINFFHWEGETPLE